MEKKFRKRILSEMLDKQREMLSTIKGAPCSLNLRHLDCGSCNACEMELHALGNPIYDLARWGIHFGAFPRHADILVLTGPYVRGLDRAARATLEAMPVPRVVTVGDCTSDHSSFIHSYAVIPMPEEIQKSIVAHIPGCPPSPQDILKVMLNNEFRKLVVGKQV